jgi:predicted nucleic acid-binding protein
LLAATLYQENPDRNHKLWNIVSTERYILHMQVLLECCYILFRKKTTLKNGHFEISNDITFIREREMNTMALNIWYTRKKEKCLEIA